MRFGKLMLVGALGVAGCYTVDDPQNPGQNPGNTALAIERFVAVQTTVPLNGAVELQYKAVGATSVTISMGEGANAVVILPNSVALEGRTFSPALIAAAKFVMTAKQGEQTVTKSVDVAVDSSIQASHAVITQFAPSPASVPAGTPTTLSWQTSGTMSGRLLANGAPLMEIATTDLATGSFMVTPTETSIYTLSVRGSDNQEVTLTQLVTVGPGGGGGATTARGMFDSQVQPILISACKDCHAGDGALEGIGGALDGPNFMGPAQAAYYGAMTGDPRYLTQPENSILITKGLHSGRAFTAQEIPVVTAWLLKELEERGNTPPAGGGVNVTSAMARFAGCMAQADWDATVGQNAQSDFSHQGTADGPCYGCHDVGAGGFVAKLDPAQTFAALKGAPGGPVPVAYLMKLVAGELDPTNGTFLGLVESNRVRDKQTDPGHPNYQMTQVRMTALTDFLTRTMTKFNNPADPCAATPPPP